MDCRILTGAPRIKSWQQNRRDRGTQKGNLGIEMEQPEQKQKEQMRKRKRKREEQNKRVKSCNNICSAAAAQHDEKSDKLAISVA